MALDAVIIADVGSNTYSGSNPLKLHLDDHIADIQTVLDYVANEGRLAPPIAGDGVMSWASAHKLNGIYLWSYLSANGFDVAVINSYYEQPEEVKRLFAQNPAVIIISTTFIYGKPALKQLVGDLRRMAPEAFIIAGGPFIHFSYLLSQRAKEPGYLSPEANEVFFFLEDEEESGVDLFVISPHGEDILCHALKQIRQSGKVADLPNTAHRESGGYRFGVQTESLPCNHPIDWQALPAAFFTSGVVPMQASSGCPYHCAFCNFVRDRKQATVKPLEAMIAEMKAAAARGARYVWFVDDNFRLGKRDLTAVCERLIQEDLGLKWMTFIRAGTVDETDIDLLRRAGCIEVQLGLESADAQVLRNMNKQAVPELYHRVLAKLLDGGINCSCYLIFGFPGETDESAMRTIDFMRRHDAAQAQGALNWSIFPFLLAPLSPVYEPATRSEYGLTGFMKRWRHNWMDSDRAMHYALKAFLALENSGPIYRGDNQDLLQRLSTLQRSRFRTARQVLSKKAMGGPLPSDEILKAFKQALQV